MTRPSPSEKPSDKAAPDSAFLWIPIRSLSARHRPRIAEHLLALPEQDRYLRFGFIASDAQITEYVERLDFARDEIFGVFSRRLQLVAMAHLAYAPDTPGGEHCAEFGVSVSARHRGRGIGARLFDQAVLRARNRHVRLLVIHALSENVAMLRIARSAGAQLVKEGGDARATLRLPEEDLASRVEVLVEERAAEVDYRLKLGAKQLGSLLESVAEVKSRIGQGVSSE